MYCLHLIIYILFLIAHISDQCVSIYTTIHNHHLSSNSMFLKTLCYEIFTIRNEEYTYVNTFLFINIYVYIHIIRYKYNYSDTLSSISILASLIKTIFPQSVSSIIVSVIILCTLGTFNNSLNSHSNGSSNNNYNHNNNQL